MLATKEVVSSDPGLDQDPCFHIGCSTSLGNALLCWWQRGDRQKRLPSRPHPPSFRLIKVSVPAIVSKHRNRVCVSTHARVRERAYGNSRKITWAQ